ncbi:MAG: biotin--[acetyl-CoA-carboxylase] ligase [Candidatus Fervidibacterota bacterium]
MERAIRQTKWLGKAWQFQEVVTSTQDIAKEWVLKGAPHGALVVADQQTAGRGRLGRWWFSPAGKNIYLTIALRLPPNPPPLGTLSLLVGVSVAEALRAKVSVPVFVKWANDIVAPNGRKLAGILVEGTEGWVLVGIGVNVNLAETEFPDKLRPVATSLCILKGELVDRWEVLAAILLSVESWWERWEAGDLATLRQAVEALDWLRGKTVRVAVPDGTIWEGVAKGVTETGELRLQLPDGSERTVAAGDVSVRPLS